MKVFGLNDTREYAQRVADRLGVPLAPHEERDFEDGEFKARPLESVRDEDVVVIQSLAADAIRSVSDKLCRLLFFCGALSDATARRVIVVAPYFAFWRKDRRTKSRDPVTTRYVARMVESVGIDAVLTLDVHSPAALDNAFAIGKENLVAAPLFAEHFAPLAAGGARAVVVSPDAGGVHRARTFAGLLAERAGRDVEVAFMEKHRSEGRVSGALFAGDVSDAAVIIFDDMVSSGGTVARAAAACAERGARSIHAAATHGVLAPGAARALAGAPLNSLVLTDSIGDVRRRCEGLRAAPYILDSTALVARTLERWIREPERSAADSPRDAD